MSADEIDYNPFYHMLQERFRDKYEKALSQRWTICIPSSVSLRGIEISENFIDVHLLQRSLSKARNWTSTDKNCSYTFELDDDVFRIVSAPSPDSDNYEAKIIHTETAYNKEFETYTLVLLDKPLSPEFKNKPSDEDRLILEKDITSLTDALDFFSNFLHPQGERWLASLNAAVESVIPSINPTTSLEKLCDLIRETVADQWKILLCTHSLKRQRDARFQGLLSCAIEIYIVNRLHDQIFPLLCAALNAEDQRIYIRAKEFYELEVTVDQLGAPEDFAVPLPAAVVELASIDHLASPMDKLSCLRTTMDLVMAEIKGAIVDAHSVLTSNEPWSPPPRPTADDLIPLIIGVLIQAKPLHFASNMFYMENFQWTLEPSNSLRVCLFEGMLGKNQLTSNNPFFSDSLMAFKAAVKILLNIDRRELKPKSRKILRDLSLEDLIKVTGEVDERFNRVGERKDIPEKERGAFSPLDRQLEHLTSMIEASTRDLDEEESQSRQRHSFPPSTSSRGLMAALQNNLGSCLTKQDGI